MTIIDVFVILKNLNDILLMFNDYYIKTIYVTVLYIYKVVLISFYQLCVNYLLLP